MLNLAESRIKSVPISKSVISALNCFILSRPSGFLIPKTKPATVTDKRPASSSRHSATPNNQGRFPI